MANGIDANRPGAADLEGIPPKLYKLALGASAGALTMVLVVMGGIVWKLNSDCPAVQRDVRDALKHIEEHSSAIDQLQRAISPVTAEEWRDFGNRLIRLEEYRSSDDASVKQLMIDMKSLHPWKIGP